MKEMITIESGFQYSINIGYDLYSDDKLKSFMPTRSALDLLEEILLSTNISSTERARILIGAYGKGKSHIVLMILSILMKRDISLFEKTMPIIEQNPRLLQLVKNYYESDNKILPVVITGSNTSLTQAFLMALQRTLFEANLEDAMPDTNYEAVIAVIERWKDEYPETYKKFKKEIGESVSAFKKRIEEFDISAYEEFEQIYPALTAGSVFNPFLGFDVVDLYESVAKGLKDKGYSGIFIVYDEFSKYLEANITNASLSDTKTLQDLAEKCNRSGPLQMHLMLISHKEIANYIDKLPKQKVDGWRGISERIKHIHLNNNFSQTYEIIASVIKKNKTKWDKFCKSHNKEFVDLVNHYKNHLIFSDSKAEFDTAIYGCYPLHPISTFILPRLSERVAQNERTLFTFLSADGNSTLMSFLREYAEDSFDFVTPDWIYDYFEPLFKKEDYSGSVHNTFILTTKILLQIPENSLESKIVKTLSLIYILEQFERLKPTKEEIVRIYSESYDVDDIEIAIHNLISEEYVVYLKRSNGYLKLKETSGVDIQSEIHDCIERYAERIDIKDILNTSNFDNYMYPSRYNDERKMTRYFSFEFIDACEVSENVDWDKKSEDITSDGIIYGIISKSDTNLKKLTSIIKKTSKNNQRYVFVIPQGYKEIETVAKEFYAVSLLKENAIDDPVLSDEYEVIFDDLNEIIKEFISTYTHPETGESVYINCGQTRDIYRKSELTELLSDICDTVFSCTPTINNEFVNKNDITSIAANSRNKIVGALLRREIEYNLGFAGNGQEVSIMRSTLIRTGVLANNETEDNIQINLTPNDENMRRTLNEIEEYIKSSREYGKISFEGLYQKLQSPENHIGLRLGVIPIYIAAVMHEYRKEVVLYDSYEQISLNADAIVQINSSPKDYFIEYINWSPEKEEYIENLAELFSEYALDSEKNNNIYDYTANAIKRWYMALPKYSKECRSTPEGEKINSKQLEMIKCLRQNISGSDLLFKRIPTAFGYNEFDAAVFNDIEATKALFDDLISQLKEHLNAKVKSLFSLKKDAKMLKKQSLKSVMTDWAEALEQETFEHLFPDGTNRFLEAVMGITNDDYAFILRVAKLATDLRIEDWDSSTIGSFISTVSQYKESAEQYHSQNTAETIDVSSNYQITFSDDEGNNTTKRFNKVEISSRGKLLYNQITASLDAMGHSITEQEKRQIIMDVLKKLC